MRDCFALLFLLLPHFGNVLVELHDFRILWTHSRSKLLDKRSALVPAPLFALLAALPLLEVKLMPILILERGKR